MTIHRYEVTDAEWAIIEPMLPKHHMGRPQKDLRAHFNGILWIARSGAGILWIARSGARWEDLPARYGPHQTVYSCFCRWRDDGTLDGPVEERTQRFTPWSIGREYLSACRYLLVTVLIVTRPSLFCRSLEKSKAATFWAIGRMGQRKFDFTLLSRAPSTPSRRPRICFTPENMTGKLTSAGM